MCSHDARGGNVILFSSAYFVVDDMFEDGPRREEGGSFSATTYQISRVVTLTERNILVLIMGPG